MAQIAIKFEQAEAVFAESHDPPFCFDEIVGIDLGSGQTNRLDEIVLPVDVHLGATKLTLGNDHYELVIKSVRVWLDKTNSDYVPGTRYGALTSFEASESQETETRYETKLAAKAAASVGSAKQEVGIEGEASRSNAKTIASKESVKRVIPLAATEGAHAVRVTLPDGIAGGLSGPVISSIAGDGSLTPFCRLVAKDLGVPVTGRIRVQARPEEMRLRRVAGTKRGVPNRSLNPKGLRAGAKALAERQAEEDQILREKIAGLALVMPPSRDPGQHIDLATKGFCFYPRYDDEA